MASIYQDESVQFDTYKTANADGAIALKNEVSTELLF